MFANRLKPQRRGTALTVADILGLAEEMRDYRRFIPIEEWVLPPELSLRVSEAYIAGMKPQTVMLEWKHIVSAFNYLCDTPSLS